MNRARGPEVNVERLEAGYRPWGRKKTVLHDMSFGLRPGVVTGLVGPNGAGKSTLLRVLLGFLPPWSGCVRIHDTEPTHYRRRYGVGYMPESVALAGHWCVETLLRYGARLSGLRTSTWAAVARDACIRAGLESMAAAPLASLSRGQVRRVVFAFAVLGDPRLVLLDEPWSHLDADGRARVRNSIERLRTDGATVVVSSHELDEVARVADTVHVIGNGARIRTLEGADVHAGSLQRALLGGGAGESA